MDNFDERYVADRIGERVRTQNLGILFLVIIASVFSFIGGTQVVQGRPIVQKNVTETKCDKTQFAIDTEAAKNMCSGYGGVADFHYDDNGKGDKTIPVIKCKN